MSQYCTNCGNKLDDGSIFCSSCGNRVEASSNVMNNNTSYNQNNYLNNTQFNQNNYSGNRNNFNRNYNNDFNRDYNRTYDRSYNNSNNNGFDMNQAENMFMTYFINVFKNKYAMFNGRASRKEYWMFVLFNFLIALGLCIVEGILGAEGILFTVYTLGTMIPSIAVAVRRLHDTGKSGTMYLVCFIPVVGIIWLVILLCGESQYGPNRFGDVSRI